MLIVESYGLAVALCVVTMLCWGSWANTQKLADEVHWTVGTWDITPLSDNPERARAQGIVYWQGRHVDQAGGALLKCYVGEDWVVERVPSGELKFVIYINSFHRFLPDAVPIELR